jgi:hypothetical protein
MTFSTNNATTCATSGVPQHLPVSSSPGASPVTTDADQTLLRQIAAGNCYVRMSSVEALLFGWLHPLLVEDTIPPARKLTSQVPAPTSGDWPTVAAWSGGSAHSLTSLQNRYYRIGHLVWLSSSLHTLSSHKW